ncbi:MAG TPA: BMP family ABC transporter substrate-binding protein [Bacteroidetes bacterium]|nr:BMP family ABC transporter substrate-binding protein [Bacteroidota bacterium]
MFNQKNVKKIMVIVFSMCLLLVGVIASYASGENEDELKVAAVYFTPVSDPWTKAVHQALLKAKENLNISYDFTENVASSDFERVMREYAERDYNIIFGDSFGSEEAARRVAKDYPEIAFCFGSGLGPQEPNFSVFDNWMHESAYLCGMIAGMITETNIIGVVSGKAIPEANRIVNGFRMGAKEVNPKVKVKIAYIGTFFDPLKAKEAAFAQIDAGADVLYGERYGVISACSERNVLVFGNMNDQNSLAPDLVITSAIWDVYPVVKKTIFDVRNNCFRATDLKEWCMFKKGGTYLAPYYSFEKKLPIEVKEAVKKRIEEIKNDAFVVPIIDSTPTSD